MIVDLAGSMTVPEFSAEICIVGAGASGIVLAAELVRQGRWVLLLESGGAQAEAAAQQLNACEYTGQPRQSRSESRFRVLGGTTTVWGGQILELQDEDFTVRHWIKNCKWPFQKAGLASYYQRALGAEGLESACSTDEDVWRAMKIEAPALGRDFSAYFTRWCPEPDFARRYRDLLQSPNLLVVLHATATKLLLDTNGARVQGIATKTPDGRERTFSAQQYILCQGTIESVRFLLQPFADGQTAPWNRSGLLGRYFQSHLDCNTAAIPAADAARLRQWFANVYLGGLKYHPKFRLNAPAQEQARILNVAGSITCIHPAEMELRRVKSLARNFLRRGDADAKLRDLPATLRRLPTMLRLAYGYRAHGRAAWPKTSAFHLRVHCEQEPQSASNITLMDDRDAAGLLRAKIDWRVSALEWKTIRKFTEFAREMFAARFGVELQPRPELANPEGHRDIVFDNSHHDMGGARMAESPSQGVVDPDLKLHGIENAYLCSAAVFPTSGFSNPTHTLIALAIRLADHLAGRKP